TPPNRVVACMRKESVLQASSDTDTKMETHYMKSKPLFSCLLSFLVLAVVSGPSVTLAQGSPFYFAGRLAHARQGHTGTLLLDGRIIVTGGLTSRGSDAFYSAEIYDPATNSWTSAADMPNGRVNHTATLLPSGKVLLAGGITLVSSYRSADLYNPTTNVWRATGDCRSER